MSRRLYSIVISLYVFAVRMAALWMPKAKQATEGRRDTFDRLREWNTSGRRIGPVVWFHCASLGEFEQGRPVIEALRNVRPDVQIALTFFSPSGFEIRRTTPLADFVCYLPFDTPSRAKQFVGLLRADLAVFIKYEYWPNHFLELKRRGTPLFVVSGIFRENQRFFGWQRKFWKPVLNAVTHFFVQNERSVGLLNSLEYSNVTLAGDTRFDRVATFAREIPENAVAEAFCKNHKILIAGSSYSAEEEVAGRFLRDAGPGWKLIIAPHNIDEVRIRSVVQRFGEEVVRLTQWDDSLAGARVLVVDTMGQLAGFYPHAHIALIGGGYGKGLHNTLEAAVHGIPVAFGPNYKRFDEACALVDCGGAFSGNSGEVLDQLMRWASSDELRSEAGVAAGKLVQSGRGAVERVLELIVRHL